MSVGIAVFLILVGVGIGFKISRFFDSRDPDFELLLASMRERKRAHDLAFMQSAAIGMSYVKNAMLEAKAKTTADRLKWELNQQEGGDS